MLSVRVTELLNHQINQELYSAYIYLDIANYYIHEGLNGYGKWYTVQAKEEQEHAMKIMKYLQDNGREITLEKIDAPNLHFENYLEPLLKAHDHERYVTELIHNIYFEASAVHDYRTMQFLDWFIKEQGEEEMNTEDQIRKFELFGGDAKILYGLDKELASRTE